MIIISSRPETEIALSNLSEDERDLIISLLYNVRLGNDVSPWTDAAFTLFKKFEQFYSDQEIADVSERVSFKIVILDDQMDPIEIHDKDNVEIRV